MIEGGNRFVVVLIGKDASIRVRQVVVGGRGLVVSLDEVESLTAARAAALAGTEPSDGLRVSPYSDNQVSPSNRAHLQSTGCQRTPNSTRQTQAQKECSCNCHKQPSTSDRCVHKITLHSPSSLPGPHFYIHLADSAFVDRADIVQYIDLPPKEAIYQILHSCLLELIKRKLVQPIVRISYFPSNSYLRTQADAYHRFAIRRFQTLRSQHSSYKITRTRYPTSRIAKRNSPSS